MPVSQRPRQPMKKKTPARKPVGGTFARLRAKAAEDEQIEPYLIEDVDPPIEIAAPETAEQQLELAALFDNEGTFRVADAKRILSLICGDSFDAVWELFRREKVTVLIGLIQDMGRHFQEQGAIENVDEEDFPGGSPASSD